MGFHQFHIATLLYMCIHRRLLLHTDKHISYAEKLIPIPASERHLTKQTHNSSIRITQGTWTCKHLASALMAYVFSVGAARTRDPEIYQRLMILIFHWANQQTDLAFCLSTCEHRPCWVVSPEMHVMEYVNLRNSPCALLVSTGLTIQQYKRVPSCIVQAQPNFIICVLYN